MTQRNRICWSKRWLAIVLGGLAIAPSARAACNLIPGTEKAFSADLGATNRPYSAPGERVEIRLRPCDPSPGFSPAGADHVVTLAFKAPSGAVRIVALAGNCGGVDLSACTGAPGVVAAVCVPATPQTLATRADVDLGDRRLGFTFPDTDALFAPDGDDVTLAGAVVIGVTAAGAPPACGLATGSCAAQTGLLACVDQLYANDGACGVGVPHAQFTHFTALPPPNDFQADCFDESPPCTAAATAVRAALDPDGNLLIPIGWGGVLVADDGVPVPRLVRTRIGSPLPFQVPGQAFLKSFTPEGGLLPPILEPQLDPTVAAPDVATFFGSVDAPYTTIRVASHHGTCNGGDQAGERCATNLDCGGGLCQTSCVAAPGTPCTVDGECPSGTCGRLFDFSPLASDGNALALPRVFPRFCQLAPHAACAGPGDCPGPGNACVAYAMEAQTPVPLDGLAASDTTRTFTINEKIDGIDRNGDGDTDDFVVTLADRTTGVGDDLGATAGCGLVGDPAGRSAMRVVQTPFSFPAVAVEDTTVAFLESEFGQDGCDQTGDADSVDGILRIFRLGIGETSVTPARAADAAPVIDGAPVAVSGGRVYVRTSEPAMAAHDTQLVSRNFTTGDAADFGGEGFSISGDGRYVAFVSESSQILAPGLDTCCRDVFVRDLLTQTTERATEQFGGGTAGGDSYYPVMARNGRYVAFESSALTLTAEVHPDFITDVFVRDLVTDTTELVSVADGGGFANGRSEQPAISDDGRWVVFATDAKNLFPPGGQTDGDGDIVVRDRCVSDGVAVPSCTPHNTLVSFAGDGSSPRPNGQVVISGDGRWIAFVEFFGSAFRYDRLTGVTQLVSTTFDGGAGDTSATFVGGLSFDGRYVLFSGGSNDHLPPGQDTNGADVFVRDMLLGITQRVSIGTNGTQASGSFTHAPVAQGLSSDGRFAAFVSLPAGSLAPEVPVGEGALFVHDRANGVTEMVHVAADGTVGNQFNSLGAYGISGDGRTITFMTQASNLSTVTSDTNGFFDSYVRGLDTTDPNGVDPLLFADGVLDDYVLEVVDAGTGAVVTHCPADEVSVGGGVAAYLRPEATAGTLACPAGSLNGDGDTDDRVVHLAVGGGATQNLGRAATDVRTSSAIVAALVSEADQGGSVLNGDGDALDTALQVYDVAGASWTNVGLAADVLAVSGERVAFITPEAAQGDGSLNGDADSTDRVAHFYDASTPFTRNVGQAADDLVLGELSGTACGDRHLLAIRSAEAAQGGVDRNGDGDTFDDVLVVYDAETDTVIEVGQAMTPCRLEACDPRAPYRVNGGEVRFLTFESEQGEDLDGNGTIGGLVLQSFDVCTGVVTLIGTVDPDSTSDPTKVVDRSQVFTTDAGRCAVEPAIACSMETDCDDGSFCDHADGRCTLTTPPTCRTGGDCPTGAVCVPARVTVATPASDRDDDGVADEIDNCPAIPNPLQEDVDGDRVGDACDVLAAGAMPTCAAIPRDNCRASRGARKSVIVVKDKTPDTGDTLVWKWTKGAATDAAHFGDPLNAHGYVLCLYDGTNELLSELTAPPGGLCRGKPCWKGLGNPAGAKGFKYGDKDLTPNGGLVIVAKPGVDGKAKIVVKGKGALLQKPPMPVLSVPLRVQLQGAGSCWETEYDAAGVSQNQAGLLKAKGPKPASGGTCQLDADCQRPAGTAECGPNAVCNLSGRCVDPDQGPSSPLCNPDAPPP